MVPTPCALSTGFLLPHPCPNAAVGTCAQCGRAVCEQHGAAGSAGLVCRACETGSDAPFGIDRSALAAAAGLAGAALLIPAFLPEDLDAFDDAALDDEGPEDAFADLS
jgi:hypothetical protein